MTTSPLVGRNETLDEKAVELRLEMTRPDSEGNFSYHLTLGNPDIHVTKVEGWMLEAADAAISVFTKVKQRLERNIVRDFIEVERIKRRVLEGMQESASAIPPVESEDIKGGLN